MLEEDVIREDAADEQVSQKEQPVEKKGKEPETETISKSELASIRRERDEARASEKYWADRARGQKEEREQKPVVEEDPDDPDPANETFVDDLSTQGLGALTKRGIPTMKGVREMIRTEATKIARQIASETVGQAAQKATTESRIMTEFPELGEPESDFYKAVAAEMRVLVKLDPGAAKSPTALYAAARAAKATLGAKAPARRSSRDEEDRYDYQGTNDEEDQRRLRADSQGATRGRGSREVLEDDDALSSQDREVISRMGITPKEFADQKRELGGRDGRGRFQAGRR